MDSQSGELQLEFYVWPIFNSHFMKFVKSLYEITGGQSSIAV